MGLLVPNKGSIYIDDKKLYSNNDPEQIYRWRLAISNVQQNIYLSNNSIAENIAFGELSEDINHDLLKRASDIAQIYEFIKQTKNKFNKWEIFKELITSVDINLEPFLNKLLKSVTLDTSQYLI